MAGVLTEDGVSRDTWTGTPARRHPLAAAGQHCPLCPRRALRRGMEGGSARPPRASTGVATADPPTASSATPTTSWSWWPAPKRTPTNCERRSQRFSPPSGCACRRRRRGLSHRRGLRLPRLPHPAAATEGVEQAYVYTFPSKKALASVKAKVKAHKQNQHEPNSGRPHRAVEPDPSRLDLLLPLRQLQGDLCLPTPLHVEPGGAVASPQARPRRLEASATTLLLHDVVAGAERHGAVRPVSGGGHPLPLEGIHIATPWDQEISATA